MALVSEVEELTTSQLAKSIYCNRFWLSLLNEPTKVPEHVYHGFCVENFHFLYRESWFDSPVLPYPACANARRLINEFYCDEHGHDQLLAKALASIGVRYDELVASPPLSGTIMLCNALAYWARYQPLFFFTTLAVLEGRENDIDSFVVACHRKGLSKSFVGPIEAHARLNQRGKHGSLTRQIFQEIPAVSESDRQSVLSLTSTFLSIYDNFYTCVWNKYSSGYPLTRNVYDA